MDVPSKRVKSYAHVIASAEAMAAQTFDRFSDIVAPGSVQKPNVVKISEDCKKSSWTLNRLSCFYILFGGRKPQINPKSHF